MEDLERPRAGPPPDLTGSSNAKDHDINIDVDEYAVNCGRPDHECYLASGGESVASVKEIKPFEICLTADKGLGLFATQSIKRGTRIISETPLIVLQHTPPIELDLDVLLAQFYKLDPNERESLLDLCYFRRFIKGYFDSKIRDKLLATGFPRGDFLDGLVKDDVRVAAIFLSNADTSSDGHVPVDRLCPTFSRINHSCIPNVYHSFNHSIGKLTVHAVRDIQEGEEILTCYYESHNRPKELRSNALQYWSFECKCPACHGPEIAKSEERRQMLLHLELGISRFLSPRSSYQSLPFEVPKNPSEAFRMAKEMLRLSLHEGIFDNHLATAYRFCSKFSLMLDNFAEAVAYAKKELEVERFCIGKETAHLETDMLGADLWLAHVENLAGSDQVKMRMCEKRDKKEDKRLEKKASKKAAKGKQ